MCTIIVIKQCLVKWFEIIACVNKLTDSRATTDNPHEVGRPKTILLTESFTKYTSKVTTVYM